MKVMMIQPNPKHHGHSPVRNIMGIYDPSSWTDAHMPASPYQQSVPTNCCSLSSSPSLIVGTSCRREETGHAKRSGHSRAMNGSKAKPLMLFVEKDSEKDGSKFGFTPCS